MLTPLPHAQLDVRHLHLLVKPLYSVGFSTTPFAHHISGRDRCTVELQSHFHGVDAAVRSIHCSFVQVNVYCLTVYEKPPNKQ